MSLALSLRSETLKLKRTLSIYLCMIGAAFGPLMSFLEIMTERDEVPRDPTWTGYMIDSRQPMSGVLLPLYVILICALLLQLEYRDKTWKQVLASPQRLADIFLAKFISLQAMIVLFITSYNVFFIILGFVVEAVRPEVYNGAPDVYRILSVNATTWFLVLGISAIQFWLSLRFRNFIAPLAIGVAAWFIAPVMLFQFKAGVMEYYPYAFPILGVWPGYQQNTVTYQWYSIITMVVFLALAFAEFKVKKVKG